RAMRVECLEAAVAPPCDRAASEDDVGITERLAQRRQELPEEVRIAVKRSPDDGVRELGWESIRTPRPHAGRDEPGCKPHGRNVPTAARRSRPTRGAAGCGASCNLTRLSTGIPNPRRTGRGLGGH